MMANFILMKGSVIKSTGSLCQVLSEDNQKYFCKIKGKTRLTHIEFTNPIVVGDNVEFTFDKNFEGSIIIVIKGITKPMLNNSKKITTIDKQIKR